MTLRLYLHPLSSYCWKVLIGLYEAGVPFDPETVNLGDPEARAAYLKISPLAKIPALVDEDTGLTLFETSVILEEVAHRYPKAGLLPERWEDSREVRLLDRFLDLHVHSHLQKVVADVLRPEGSKDPFGVAQAKTDLRAAYDVLEARIAGRAWTANDDFTLADCAAAPALYYADFAEPVAPGRPNLSALRQRLMERPSVARAMAEAQPFMHWFPLNPKP